MSILDSIQSLFGGTPSAPGTKSQYYQTMPDGTHLVSVLDNGKLQDQGLVDAKPDKALTDAPVVKTLNDGSTWGYKFNPDGSVAKSVKLADAGGKPVDPSLSAQRDARTSLIEQQLADAEAMAPLNIDKAKATIANLSARTDLAPAEKDLINARVQRIASQNGLDTAKLGLIGAQTGKTNAQTDLYTAEGQAKINNAFWIAQQKINSLYESVGKPGGPANRADADALAQQIYDVAAREAATGISATQQASNDLTAQRQAVDQGDNRATNTTSLLNNLTSTIGAAKMPPGSTGAGDLMGAMIKGYPAILDSTGGGPVNIQGAGGNFLSNMGASPRVEAAGGVRPQAEAPSGVDVSKLPPADLQQIHDRTQQLAAGSGDLAGAAKQALSEYLSAKAGADPATDPKMANGMGAGGLGPSPNPPGGFLSKLAA